MRKKILLVALAMSIGLSAAGCAKSTQNSAEPTQTQTETETSAPESTETETTESLAEADNGMVTVVDQAGREVTVGEVNNIAVCWYMANDFVLAMGRGDQLSVIGPHDDFQIMVLPKIPEMDTIGRGRPDMEKLAALNPDLFIHTVGDKDNVAAVEALDIPMIQIDPETVEKTLEAYTIIGKAIGDEDRAEMLNDYYQNIVDRAEAIVADTPEEERPTFVIIGEEPGMVADGKMMQSEMIVNGGGINMASQTEGDGFWPVAGTEQIFAWDPDVLLISQTAGYTAESIINDPAWAELKAVKNGAVYQIPGSLHNWENPGMGTCLGTLWAATKFYPDVMDEAEFDQIVVDFYQDIYNLKADRETIGY